MGQRVPNAGHAGYWSVVPRSHDPNDLMVPKIAERNQACFARLAARRPGGMVPLRVRKTIPAPEGRAGGSGVPSRCFSMKGLRR